MNFAALAVQDQVNPWIITWAAVGVIFGILMQVVYISRKSGAFEANQINSDAKISALEKKIDSVDVKFDAAAKDLSELKGAFQMFATMGGSNQQHREQK